MRMWAWWWAGFIASASMDPSLVPPASGGGTESGDVLKWGYVTPASKHANGRLDPGQDTSNVSSRSFLIDTFDYSGPDTYLRRPLGSSVLLAIVPSGMRHKVIWRFMSHERELIILEHISYSNLVSFNSYFKHRVKYDLKTGSLSVNKLEMTDNGLFEVILNELTIDKTIQSRYVYFYLEVQEQLLAPMIFQNPPYILDRVQLSCIVKTGKATAIEWLKDNKQLKNQSHFKVDGTSLFIEKLRVSDCGLYTCRVTNDVSTNQNSHFITANGILFIVFYAFVTLVIALVSNFTSFIAAVIITFVALRNVQVEKYRRELTTIFVTFQLLSFICLLLASLLCIYDAGFTPWFRLVAGFGCLFSLTMIIYVAVLLLHPNTEDYSTFISNNYHCCIIYLLGPVSVLVPSVLLYKAIYIGECTRGRKISKPK